MINKNNLLDCSEITVKTNGIGPVGEIIILLDCFYFVLPVLSKEIHKNNLGSKKFHKLVKSGVKNHITPCIIDLLRYDQKSYFLPGDL